MLIGIRERTRQTGDPVTPVERLDARIVPESRSESIENTLRRLPLTRESRTHEG
jgi:hypothetical protein